MACKAGEVYGEAGHSDLAKKWNKYTITAPGDEDYQREAEFGGCK